VDRLESLRKFLEDPDAASLAVLAEELEDWPAAAGLQRLAARALYLEDERLAALLKEAAREARRLLEEL